MDDQEIAELQTRELSDFEIVTPTREQSILTNLGRVPVGDFIDFLSDEVADDVAIAIEDSVNAVKEAELEAKMYAKESLDLRDAAEDFANAAAQSAEQAQQISDPENRIGALQCEKLNKGNLFFAGGTIRGQMVMPTSFPFSIAARLKIDDFNSGNQTIFTIADFPSRVISLYLYNEDLVLKITSNISGETLYNYKHLDLNSAFIGKFNDIVWIVNSLNNYTLFINGNAVQLTTDVSRLTSMELGGSIYYSANNNNPNFTTNPGNANPIELADVAVFNFDMSAQDAPYSISDFSSGKAIPPAAQKGFGLLNPVVGTSNGQISQAFNTTIVSIAQSGNTITAATTGSSGETASRIYCTVDPTKPIYIYNSEIISSNNINFRVRIYYTDGTNTTSANIQSGVSVTLTPDVSKTINYLALLYLCYSATTGDATIIDFCVQQNGALLALENYTIKVGSTQYVPDVSGNNYDATVSGSVAGTNDIAVAKLADLINQRGA